ncbi:hypothetical protein EJ06DRAFT_488742 [Trichodelitschia bisporula]|uniref:Uncharacterized protein n=1 Tax=Trichodelitschia bisporula TaxID=703511 RepID=A0A6G1I6M8_9PEZI|nr:hypothetical protein EJ06DRAFT_488742 [Trichodelitschia bisporula]
MGPIKQLWLRWKSLQLPWRKKWLVGSDLSGNTFWEFRDQINIGRVRRIVHYDPKAHYADVKLAPQWVQWLRHTRADPPSVHEQQQDLVRLENLKHLVAAADARWKSLPSARDPPVMQMALPGAKLAAGPGDERTTEAVKMEGVKNHVVAQDEAVEAAEEVKADTPPAPEKGHKVEETEAPWKKHQQTDERDVPKPWSPQVTVRR